MPPQLCSYLTAPRQPIPDLATTALTSPRLPVPVLYAPDRYSPGLACSHLTSETQMDMFSPHREDGRAEWKVIYDHARTLPYAADLTFDEIAKLLDTDDRARAHRAIRRCNQQFTRENIPRVLGNVRAVGYRVLKPSEYATAAIALQVQGKRKVSSALDLMRTAPIADMSPQAQDWAHKVTLVLMDNDLRLRSQEQWQQSAEQRLTELERRAGIPPAVIDGEIED